MDNEEQGRLYQEFSTGKEVSLRLPPGQHRVVVSRGPEYEIFDKIITVLDRPTDPEIAVRVVPLEFAKADDKEARVRTLKYIVERYPRSRFATSARAVAPVSSGRVKLPATWVFDSVRRDPARCRSGMSFLLSGKDGVHGARRISAAA